MMFARRRRHRAEYRTAVLQTKDADLFENLHIYAGAILLSIQYVRKYGVMFDCERSYIKMNGFGTADTWR